MKIIREMKVEYSKVQSYRHASNMSRSTNSTKLVHHLPLDYEKLLEINPAHQNYSASTDSI